MALLENLRRLLDLTSDEAQDLFGSLDAAAGIARRFQSAFSDMSISAAFAEIAAVSEEYRRLTKGPRT